MSESRFEVVTRGIADGVSTSQVKERLKKLIKSKNVNLDRIIDKGELVVKRDLDLETANKYKSAFQRAGILCEIRRRDEPLETMICPKCGFRQPKEEVCIRCGIVIEKYHEQDTSREYEEAEVKEERRIKLYEPKGLLGYILPEKLKGLFSIKAGPYAIVIIGLFVAYLVFEMIWLKGDIVAHKKVRLTSARNFLEFKAEEVSSPYLVQVSTRKKQKLHIRLVDSAGEVLYEDTEYASHRGTRSFTFKPPSEGRYRVYVDFGPLSLSAHSTASIRIYVNDRRILTRILDRLKL